jgi:hypothetical protein
MGAQDLESSGKGVIELDIRTGCFGFGFGLKLLYEWEARLMLQKRRFVAILYSQKADWSGRPERTSSG